MINQHRLHLCDQLLYIDNNSSRLKFLYQQLPLIISHFSNLHLSNKKWCAINASNLRRNDLCLINIVFSNAFLNCASMALLLTIILNIKSTLAMNNFFLINVLKFFLATTYFSKHLCVARASMHTVSSIFISTFSISKNFFYFVGVVAS